MRGRVEDDDRLDDRIEEQPETVGLAIEVGILDRGGRDRCQVFREDQVLGPELAGGRGRRQGQGPEDALTGSQRDAHVGVQLETAQQVAVAFVPCDRHQGLGRDVRNEDRLAGPDDLERPARLVRVVGVLVEQLADQRDLGRIHMGDRERAQLTVRVEQVDRAPIGDPRHREIGQVTDRPVVTQRPRQELASLGQEALVLTAASVAQGVVDVRARPHPAGDAVVVVAARDGAQREPAVLAVVAPEADPGVDGLLVRRRRGPPLGQVRYVVGVEGRIVGQPRATGRGIPGVGGPAAVAIEDAPGCVGPPGDQRDRLGQVAISAVVATRSVTNIRSGIGRAG